MRYTLSRAIENRVYKYALDTKVYIVHKYDCMQMARCKILFKLTKL